MDKAGEAHAAVDPPRFALKDAPSTVPSMRPEILFPLFAPVSALKGVGPKILPLVEKLAGPLARDVLFLQPQGVIHRGLSDVAHAREGEVQTLKVQIEAHFPSPRPAIPWKIRAYDGTGFLTLVFLKGGSPPLQRQLPVGEERVVSGKAERFGGELQ